MLANEIEELGVRKGFEAQPDADPPELLLQDGRRREKLPPHVQRDVETVRQPRPGEAGTRRLGVVPGLGQLRAVAEDERRDGLEGRNGERRQAGHQLRPVDGQIQRLPHKAVPERVGLRRAERRRLALQIVAELNNEDAAPLQGPQVRPRRDALERSTRGALDELAPPDVTSVIACSDDWPSSASTLACQGANPRDPRDRRRHQEASGSGARSRLSGPVAFRSPRLDLPGDRHPAKFTSSPRTSCSERPGRSCMASKVVTTARAGWSGWSWGNSTALRRRLSCAQSTPRSKLQRWRGHLPSIMLAMHRSSTAAVLKTGALRGIPR